LGELNRVLQEATTDEVRTSYKKLALQYHPDKNKAEDATEKFQEIGGAYNAILKHLERPSHGWADDGDDGGIYHYDDDYYENDMEFLL
jgi:curved DNA-binding protein CbpA